MCTSLLHPHKLLLGASHGFYTWTQIFEWTGADTNRGQILFHSAQAIVRILFEGGYYSTCGYYSRKYGKCTASKHMQNINVPNPVWKDSILMVIKLKYY